MLTLLLQVKVDRQKYLAKKKLLKQDQPVTDEEVDKLLAESDSGGEALLKELVTKQRYSHTERKRESVCVRERERERERA